MCGCRVEGLVSAEHRRHQPPKPGQWKGQRQGQMSDRRRRGSSNQTEDNRCRPAADLPDGRQPSSPAATPQTDAATFGHVPRTPAARQVRSEDHFSSDEVQPDLPPPPQVCGWCPLPGRLPCTEAGSSSPRPGPPISRNSGLTSPDVQPQAGFLGGLEVLRTTGGPEPAEPLW